MIVSNVLTCWCDKFPWLCQILWLVDVTNSQTKDFVVTNSSDFVPSASHCVTANNAQQLVVAARPNLNLSTQICALALLGPNFAFSAPILQEVWLWSTCFQFPTYLSSYPISYLLGSIFFGCPPLFLNANVKILCITPLFLWPRPIFERIYSDQ